MCSLTVFSTKPMYLVLLTLTLLACLTAARRFAEPACPSCASKSWNDRPPVLECSHCGWTNVATVAVPVQPERAR